MNQFPAYNSITEETRNTDGYLIIITHKHKRGTDRNGQAASTPVPSQPGINKSPQRPHPLHIIKRQPRKAYMPLKYTNKNYLSRNVGNTQMDYIHKRRRSVFNGTPRSESVLCWIQ